MRKEKRKGLNKMTAQEVWEYWKDNPEAKFDDGDDGAYIYKCVTKRTNSSMRPSETIIRNYGSLGVDEVLPIDVFMNGDWQPVDRWLDVEVLEGVECFLYRGKTLKRTRNGEDELFNLKNGDVLGIDAFSELYTW